MHGLIPPARPRFRGHGRRMNPLLLAWGLAGWALAALLATQIFRCQP